jgi:hypothetical protein
MCREDNLIDQSVHATSLHHPHLPLPSKAMLPTNITNHPNKTGFPFIQRKELESVG